MGTEDFKAGSHRPIKQGSFLEVANTVGVESDPIVTKKHLARDFGVNGVSVIEQRRRQERVACVEEKPESKKDKTIPSRLRERASHRNSV